MSGLPPRREVGVELVNDDGMPHVRVSRLATIQRNQFLRLETARGHIDIRVTPTGYLRVESE